jgi:PAS domain S-box-containing protein
MTYKLQIIKQILNSVSAGIKSTDSTVIHIKDSPNGLRNTKLPIDYKNILNSINQGVYAIDLNGIAVYCNSSCWKMLNYNSAEDLLGKNIHELFHYAHSGGTFYPSQQCKIYKAFVEGREIFADDEVFWTKDGKPIPVAYYSYPQYKDGKLTGAVITFSDISLKENKPGKSIVSEAKYGNIFKRANAGIIYVDKDGYTISANQAFQDMLQYSLTELQQISLAEIENKEDSEKGMVLRREIAEGKREEYSMERRYLRKDGKQIWVNTSVSSFRKTPSSPLHYVGVVHDITDKKQFELELIESNASKDKFFSIIAHDLHNPICSIKLLSEYIKEELDQNNIVKASELSDLLLTEVRHTDELLNDLLAWSLAQTKRMSFNPQLLNIEEIFLKQIATNEILAKNKHISFEYTANSQIIVLADLNMLNTILRNLITNAIKFSFENSKITLRAEERPGDILISVQDRGKGIHSGILEKLFRPDSKISTQGTNNETGTGLGLLLCKEFIELHNNRIWVESIEGKGSKFLFTLPKV